MGCIHALLLLPIEIILGLSLNLLFPYVGECVDTFPLASGALPLELEPILLLFPMGLL